MKTGNALTALVVLGVVGTAAYQWKTLVQSEMHVAQHNRYDAKNEKRNVDVRTKLREASQTNLFVPTHLSASHT